MKWRTNTVTFANAGTTVKVRIAPLVRASHASDVITFNVSKSHAGGITSNATQSNVPDTGSKTI